MIQNEAFNLSLLNLFFSLFNLVFLISLGCRYPRSVLSELQFFSGRIYFISASHMENKFLVVGFFGVSI